MNGFYKIIEASQWAIWHWSAVVLWQDLLVLFHGNEELMRQNEALQKSNKGLLHALAKQNSDRRDLERQVVEQAEHIHLLWSMIIAPDPPVWHKYGLTFALGFMAAMALASVLI